MAYPILHSLMLRDIINVVPLFAHTDFLSVITDPRIQF